jgi:hypothetical protein
MNRISSRNRDYRETHPEAQDWLYHFTLDLKKMFYKTSGENYQPFSMERLEEWTQHREDIETCGSFLSEQFKSLHNPFVHDHDKEVMAINAVIINLKLMLIGEKYELAESMIQEADRAFMEITRCRKRRVVFYR